MTTPPNVGPAAGPHPPGAPAPRGAASVPPPGPVQPGTHPPVPAPPGRRPGRLAILVSFVAVLLALLSMGVAGWALHRANVAVDAAGRPGATDPAATVPATDPPVDAPTAPTDAATTATDPATVDPNSTDLPPIDPEANFAIAYEKTPMTVRVRSSGSREIDLDKPSVDADADIRLDGDTQATNLFLASGVTAATAESPTVQPKECLSRIQLSALEPSSPYPLRKGQVFCVLTSPGDAQTKGEPQKLVVISVSGISDDREVSLLATAYVVPR